MQQGLLGLVDVVFLLNRSVVLGGQGVLVEVLDGLRGKGLVLLRDSPGHKHLVDLRRAAVT